MLFLLPSGAAALPAQAPGRARSAAPRAGASAIAEADAFPGSDFCVKLRAANLAAVAEGQHLVDATRFSGVQSCSVDPVQGLAENNRSVNLADRLGAVVIETTVPWRVTNPGLTLEGVSAQTTFLRYTGSTLVPAVLTLQSRGFSGAKTPYDPGIAGNLYGVNVRHMTVLGASGNAVDAIYAAAWHHSELDDVWTWGVKGCGVHTYFAVTDTFYRLRSSSEDKREYGFGGDTPAHGLCFDGATAVRTTNGTVIDAASEGLTGVGWVFHWANNMTTTGTSEGNAGGGVEIDAVSTSNTFLDLDLEGSGRFNMQDNGTTTTVINAIMDWKPLIIGPQSIGFSMTGGNETAAVEIDPKAQQPSIQFGSTMQTPMQTHGIADSGEVAARALRVGGRATISSGSGRPSGSCSSGSLYLNQAGGSGSTLFVCEGGAWKAR